MSSVSGEWDDCLPGLEALRMLIPSKLKTGSQLPACPLSLYIPLTPADSVSLPVFVYSEPTHTKLRSLLFISSDNYFFCLAIHTLECLYSNAWSPFITAFLGPVVSDLIISGVNYIITVEC